MVLGSADGEGVAREGSREIRRAAAVRVGRVVVEEGRRTGEGLAGGSAGTGKICAQGQLQNCDQGSAW